MRILKEFTNPSKEELEEINNFDFGKDQKDNEEPAFLINGNKLPDNLADIYFIDDECHLEEPAEPITYIAIILIDREDLENL